jgi:hypothetical protein
LIHPQSQFFQFFLRQCPDSAFNFFDSAHHVFLKLFQRIPKT